METTWTLVFTTEQLIQAQIVQQMLESNGIESVIMNKRDSSYLTFGEVELYVNKNDESKAKELIENL